VRFLLASIYQQSNQIDKSIDEYLLLEDSQAFRIIAINNLIWLFVDTADARLEDYVVKLAEMKPEAPEIMDTLGWAYLQSGKKEKAGEYLLKAAEKLKDNLSVQYHLGVYLSAIGETPKAREVLSAIVGSGKAFAERNEAEKLLSTL
jgi:tetratricopeptide (TPR) repeat protein